MVAPQIPANHALPPAPPPAAAEAQTAPTAPPQPPATAAESPGSGITEEQLKQALVGKPFYLRNCYLDAGLSFNEHGAVTGHPAPGSYTLCGVAIEKIRLSKHKVELLGARYGLHFLGALPYEDPTKAVDRVRITPNKKIFRITIDREVVVKPKKVKDKSKSTKGKEQKPAAATPPAQDKQQAGTATPRELKPVEPKPTQASDAKAPANAADQAAASDDEKDDESELSETDQLKASLAAAPEAEKPADPNSVTTTTSPTHAAQVLREALDKIFAPGLDERMMATMPDFWKLYYQAAAAKSDYRPTDPAVLRQGTVDHKAHLITSFEPSSNEFAQAAGVAGMALYHVVIGLDGKPGEVAVARPIGFGLDENAVAAIRNARFEPAMKDGKPVQVLVDLVVQFRIFSKRTAVMDAPQAADKATKPASATPPAPILPGPYSRQQ